MVVVHLVRIDTCWARGSKFARRNRDGDVTELKSTNQWVLDWEEVLD